MKAAASTGRRVWANCSLPFIFGMLLIMVAFGLLLSSRAVAQSTPAQWSWHVRNATGSPPGRYVDVPGTYPTKAQAVAAMYAYLNKYVNFPAAIALIKESGVSEVDAHKNEVAYKYSAPPMLSSDPAWNCYTWFGPCYPDEASAVAAFTSMPGCSVQNQNSGNVWIAPSGDWGLVTGPPNVPNAGTLNEQQERPYEGWQQSPLNNCTTVDNGPFHLLDRYRTVQCPAGYFVPTSGPYPDGAIQCTDPVIAYVVGQQLECPQSGAGSTSVGDPCDVATGDFSQTETDYTAAGLSLVRYYHSATLEAYHALGTGWTHSYAASMVFDINKNPVGLLRPDGHQDAVENINGEYVSDSGAGIHVVNSGGNWVASLSDGSSEIYSTTGQLLQLLTASGQATTLAYNSTGQLVSVTGPFGHSLQFAYDGNDRIVTVTEPDGSSTITYGYDSNNNLVSATYPDSSVRQYQFQNTSLPNHLTAVIDESGRTFVTVQYDSTTGAVLASQQAGGAQSVSISYSANTATVVDSLGATSLYTFTATGETPRMTGLQRSGQLFSYAVPDSATDPQRRVTQATDPNGDITGYSYDADHLLSKTEAATTALARTTTYQYLSANSSLPTLVSQPLKNTSSTYYGGTSLVHARTVTDVATGATRTWNYTYDGYGRLLTAQGPRTDVSSTTTYTYNQCTTGGACGQVATVTDAVGHVTTYSTYNAHALPLAIIDPNGAVTTLTYDTRQRVLSRSANGETTSYSYYPTGLLKTATLPDGSSTQYTYDGAHRLTQISDAQGNKTVYILDAMGNRVAETTLDPNGVLHRMHSRVFNALNQLYQDINAAGTAAVTTTYSYDNDGNPTSTAAPMGRTAAKAYDALNRLSQATDPASGVTQYAYDTSDNLVSVTDPRSLVTSYGYNGFGDRVRQVSPDSGTTSNTYDSAGNLATTTDARGATATYSYDALNRITSIAYSLGGAADQTIAFTYDSGMNGKGRLTGASDANHLLSWEYDALGRVVSKSQTASGITKSVGYTYTNGDLTSILTPSGQSVVYSYINHQISSIAVNGTPLLGVVTYEPFGAVNGWTWGNSTTVSRTYDQDGNVAQISSGGETYQYTPDSAQRITAISNIVYDGLSWSFGYDNLDRLTTASSSWQSDNYSYELTGTRSSWNSTIQGEPFSAAYTVDPASNRITSIGLTGSSSLSTPVQYDVAGNVVSEWGSTATYNAAGRPVSLAGMVSLQATYNALGQRISKVSPSGTTLFVYDENGHLMGEYDGTGTLVEETIWLGDTPVATLRPNSDGTLGVYYVHSDHLNAPRKVSRPTDNQLTWRWDPEPFGDAQPDENPLGLGQFSYNLRFPGQYFDAESGYYYNDHRYYDPLSGIYLQSDPIGLQGGINTYAYASGDPVSNADPRGLETGPAYHAIYTWDLPPPPPKCDGTCKGADQISLTFSDSACGEADTDCFLAMQAAGLSHPPRTVYYSATCLLKAGVLLKPAGYATSETIRRGGPWLLARVGASEAIVGLISRGLSAALGPESLLVWVPLGLSETNSECQCSKQ